MRCLRLTVPLALVGLLLMPVSHAVAKAVVPPARAAVEQVLRAHDLGPTDQDLAALGAGVDQVLVTIAADAQADVLLRARAVSALAFTPTAKGRKFLEQTVSGPTTGAAERLLARKAALALGWLGGAGVPALVAPLLEHKDADVRIDGALALGLTRLESAADRLRQRLPAEQDARVRATIGRQLRAIEAALVASPRPAKP